MDLPEGHPDTPVSRAQVQVSKMDVSPADYMGYESIAIRIRLKGVALCCKFMPLLPLYALEQLDHCQLPAPAVMLKLKNAMPPVLHTA